MARFRLIPREEKFYDDFKLMADQLRHGARLLEAMFAVDPPLADKAHEVKEIEQIRGAVAALEQKKGLLANANEINRLENEADKIHKQAIGQLFDEEKDPIAVIKWKEIYDILEEATDACEDVANLLENVVVKHG